MKQPIQTNQTSLFPELTAKYKGKKQFEYTINVVNQNGKINTEKIKAENTYHLCHKFNKIPKYFGHTIKSIWLNGIQMELPNFYIKYVEQWRSK